VEAHLSGGQLAEGASGGPQCLRGGGSLSHLSTQGEYSVNVTLPLVTIAVFEYKIAEYCNFVLKHWGLRTLWSSRGCTSLLCQHVAVPRDVPS